MDDKNLAEEYADQLAQSLTEIWAAIDADEEYEGQDPREYLDEMPLEVVWQAGEPFAVVLTTGGPHVEITGGGSAQPVYSLDVYWGVSKARRTGEAVTLTGTYFRDLLYL